jgi:lipoprotein-releasing system permease protein
MYQPLFLFIGLRYTRAKRKNHFVSFIALFSMLGIALGVATLITVLSVMNGFDEEIRQRFFSMAPHATVNSYTGEMGEWSAILQQVEEFPGVTGVAPYVGGQGMLTHFEQVLPIVVVGILPEYEIRVTEVEERLVEGQLTDLQPGEYGLIIGSQMAAELGLLEGDKVNLMIPQASVTPAGLLPRFKRFTVVGIFSAGTGFNFDNALAFMHLRDAQTLFQFGDNVSGLRLKTDNIYHAPTIAARLTQALPGNYFVGDWTQQFGTFFDTIKLEKTMMFLVLMLIIAVAVFNLVSSLVMVVTDKQADIAILRTMGMLPKQIMAIFMVQGLTIGIVGLLLGLGLGLVLAINTTEIVNGIQYLLGQQILANTSYFLDYLPSKILWQDLVKIGGLTLVMSFLATLYPAWRAAKTQPAEALRYE